MDEGLKEKIENIVYALRDISHGGTSGPMGIEALVMAISGPGTPGDSNLVSALSTLADAICEQSELSDGLHDIAGAIRELAVAVKTK